MTSAVTPRALVEGDTVAVVSPSFGAVGTWPHRAERGIAYLESLGLKVRVMPHAAGVEGWVSASAEARASDLHEAFSDPQVGLVLASIGGNHSNALLPLLDHDLIRANPKWFQGYSDMTVLHWAFLKHSGLATLYGTALVTGMAEYPAVLPYTDRWLKAAWFRTEPLRFSAAEAWTGEFLDWDRKADLERPRALQPSDGWVTIRGGRAEGTLLGGCLETICWHLKGSDAWLDVTGAILLLETSEEAPSPEHVDAYLTGLDHLGVFERITGLIVARPLNYRPDDVPTLWDVIERVTRPYDLPVLGNVDCGHADPMLTIPFGVPGRLDATERYFEAEL